MAKVYHIVSIYSLYKCDGWRCRPPEGLLASYTIGHRKRMAPFGVLDNEPICKFAVFSTPWHAEDLYDRLTREAIDEKSRRESGTVPRPEGDEEGEH